MTFTERCERLAGVMTARMIAAGQARWLTDAFVRFGGGARLEAWKLAGAPTGPFEACYVGDPALERLVDHVLGRLPSPVAWHIARAVLVIGHRRSGGLCTVIPKLPPCDEAHQLVIVNCEGGESESEIASIIAHEFGHAWTFERVEPAAVVTSQERRAFYAGFAPFLKKYPELVKDAATKDLQLELLACELAREWKFAGIGTNDQIAMSGAVRAWIER